MDSVLLCRSRIVLAVAFAALAPGCRGEHVVGARTADCPGLENAGYITVADGRVLIDKAGVYDRSCPGTGPAPGKGVSGCVEQHFYVFPLVPATWSAPEPIPAWLTCRGDVPDLASCAAQVSAYGGALGGKVAVRVGDGSRPGGSVSGWERAVADSVGRHGLVSSSRGPVLWLGLW